MKYLGLMLVWCWVLVGCNDDSLGVDGLAGTYSLDVEQSEHFSSWQEDGLSFVGLSLGIECDGSECRGYLAEYRFDPIELEVMFVDDTATLTPKDPDPSADGHFSNNNYSHTYESITLERQSDGTVKGVAYLSVKDTHYSDDIENSESATWQARISAVDGNNGLNATISARNYQIPWESIALSTLRPVNELDANLYVSEPEGLSYEIVSNANPGSTASLIFDDIESLSGQTVEISLKDGAVEPGGHEQPGTIDVAVRMADLGSPTSEIDLAEMPPISDGMVSSLHEVPICDGGGCWITRPVCHGSPENPGCIEAWSAFWLESENGSRLNISLVPNRLAINTIEVVDIETGAVILTEEFGVTNEETPGADTFQFDVSGTKLIGVKLSSDANPANYAFFNTSPNGSDVIFQRIWID